MAGTKKPGDGQTQRVWPMVHHTKNGRSLPNTVSDRITDTVTTGGENLQIHSPPLPNGDVSVPHLSTGWGTEGNSMQDQGWISHQTSGGPSHRDEEGPPRLGTLGAFQDAPLPRRAIEMFQVPKIRAPQSNMPQRRVLRNLQWQTRDLCLHKQTQGGSKHNSTLCKLQREPPCVDRKMPRASETDSDRTTPGHRHTAKEGEGSYTEETSYLHNSSLNLRIRKNGLFCGEGKGSSETNSDSQASKGREVTKGKEPSQNSGRDPKPCGSRTYPQREERPGHLVKSSAKAKAKAEKKKMISAQIQTSPIPATPRETQTPIREIKDTVTQTPTPSTKKEGDYCLTGTQLVLMMQTFATTLAAQLNITLQTEQVKKATRATLNASKFLTKTREEKTRTQQKMSISLDAGMNTSMETVDP